MSSKVFRQIAIGNDRGRPERLFRAAICAFCSLPRPARREVAQLDDLALPLFDTVSQEARRFAAAALSESNHVPPGLVRRLVDEPVAIAAPLLMRSPVLKDIDLVRLIGRHGVGHARVIARRHSLNPAIAALIRALLASDEASERSREQGDAQRDAAPVHPAPSPSSGPEGNSGQNAEQARRRLRTMMRPGAAEYYDGPGAAALGREAKAYGKLRSAALAGRPASFELALADALEITILQAREITSSRSYDCLLTALRALDLAAEQAFLISNAVFPAQFENAEAIKLFVERFEAMEHEAARDTFRRWKDDGLTVRFQNAETPADASGGSLLRAS